MKHQNLTTNDLQNVQWKLEKIQRKMLKQIGKLEEVIDELGDEGSRAYILNHLKILTSSDHSFLTRDRSISDMIQAVGEWIVDGDRGEEGEEDNPC